MSGPSKKQLQRQVILSQITVLEGLRDDASLFPSDAATLDRAIEQLQFVARDMHNVTTKRTTERVSAKMTPELRRQIIQRVQTSVDTPYAAIAKEFNVAGGRVTEIMRSIGH